MKLKYFFYSFLLVALTVNAQYQTVSIPELNMVTDSVLTNATKISDIKTQYSGDTVKVVGTVLLSTMVDWDTDRRLTTSRAPDGAFLTFLQDTSGALWGGLTINQDDTSYATGLDIVASGDVIEVTGVISEGEFGNTTTIDVLINPLSDVNILSSGGSYPEPIVVTISEFYDGDSFNFEAEKYEGMYVEFQNVTTQDRNPTSSTSFAFSDGSGKIINMYDQSSYFTERSGHKLVGITDYVSPADGTLLEYIRGIIHTRDAGWYIVPLNPGDMKEMVITAPKIDLVKNANAKVAPNETAEVKFAITDDDGTISEAKLFYQVDGGAFTEMAMTMQDSEYVVTIPGIVSDSSFVSYFIQAVDNDANVTLSPSDTSKALHYYWVLKNGPTIFHVQYTPYRGGDSRFKGDTLTVSGVVTVDSSDNQYGIQFIQQPGLDKWAGLRMKKVPLMGQVRGDLVTVTGTLIEDYGHTTLDVTDLVIEATGGDEIVPLALTCDQIELGRNDFAEEYESMLLKYENVAVDEESADGTSNFGEILISDATGQARVELQDGAHSYHNNWNASLADSSTLIGIYKNDSFESITGVLYYSFSNFKLLPRKNDDFVGYVTGVETTNTVPDNYSISQNYPNPFNPTTLINYAVPNGNASFVQLKVYDILGREIRTLVSEIKSPGTYQVSFNASELSTGIYFYTLSAGDFYQTKKMILMK